MKKETKFIITIIFSTLLIASAIYFKPTQKPQNLTINNPIEQIRGSKIILSELKDRSDNGICRDMYAEGFDWGLKQIMINFQTEFLNEENLTEEQKAMKWYRYFIKWQDDYADFKSGNY